MKRILSIFIAFFVLASCNNLPVEKPDHFIEEEMMTNILSSLNTYRKPDTLENRITQTTCHQNKP
jgi:hypothetical protein